MDQGIREAEEEGVRRPMKPLEAILVINIFVNPIKLCQKFRVEITLFGLRQQILVRNEALQRIKVEIRQNSFATRS